MWKKNKKIFNKKMTIDDFTIPEFVKWMGTIDLSDYIQVIRVGVEEDVDYANIVVINSENIAIEGAIVEIDGLEFTAQTDAEGRCFIDGFPASQQHLVHIIAEGYESYSEYLSAETLTSTTITLYLSNEIPSEESNSETPNENEEQNSEISNENEEQNEG